MRSRRLTGVGARARGRVAHVGEGLIRDAGPADRTRRASERTSSSACRMLCGTASRFGPSAGMMASKAVLEPASRPLPATSTAAVAAGSSWRGALGSASTRASVGAAAAGSGASAPGGAAAGAATASSEGWGAGSSGALAFAALARLNLKPPSASSRFFGFAAGAFLACGGSGTGSGSGSGSALRAWRVRVAGGSAHPTDLRRVLGGIPLGWV